MIRSGFDGTTRLAKRVLDGEVVFFVGSGFSIDSEGNDARRLVGRLLAAILAMATILNEESEADQSQASLLLDRLERVFSLGGASDRSGGLAREPARCMTDANLKLLAREYFNFNDWATSALGVLSGELLSLEERRCADAAGQMQKLATFLLGLVGDNVPLDPIDCRALRAFRSEADRGKALFLDTMGFANPLIMAGTALDQSIEQVARSFRGRIRPRHHVLARLAREGLARALVTTNYDLLLEGAYRLAGFLERETADAPDGTPSDALPRFSRISGADQFFARGQGYRTALLLKIHGCVQFYRNVRAARLQALVDAERTGDRASLIRDAWSGYLPALVFTYREIQTWRSDAWSRDLIRTLLRTHTIALCGYSGADPVMHSTFREVYDEKVLSRGATANVPPPKREKLDTSVEKPETSADNAAVFFFGLSGRREFHSLEILRAATAAAGLDTVKLVDHPNHIEFERAQGFPTIDDHFRWLAHSVIRQLQADALRTRLRRLMPRLLRREQPPRDKDLERAYDRFNDLRLLENEFVATLNPARIATTTPSDPKAAARQTAERLHQFDRVASWTWNFVPGLMREFALAHTVELYQGAGRAIRTARTPTYYYPISEQPDWGAWAVIVELALRSLVAALTNAGTLFPRTVIGEEGPHAAISFRTAEQWQPTALCIRLAGFERPDRSLGLTGAFHRVTYWELGEQDVPWPFKPRGSCPSSLAIWEWAIGAVTPTRQEAARHLGVEL